MPFENSKFDMEIVFVRFKYNQEFIPFKEIFAHFKVKTLVGTFL